MTVAAYDVESGYLVWTNGYGRGFASGGSNVILAGINSTAGSGADGYQYTVSPAGIVDRIPGADSIGNLTSAVSHAKVDGTHYAIGAKGTPLDISVFEVHPSNGLQNEVATGKRNSDYIVDVSDSRIILYRNGLGTLPDIYSVLDSTSFTTTEPVRFDAYNSDADLMAFSNPVNDKYWVGSFPSTVTNTGATRIGTSRVSYVDASGSLFVLSPVGSFPNTFVKITKIPDPYSSSSDVTSSVLFGQYHFVGFSDDQLFLTDQLNFELYDNDLNLLWSTVVDSAFTGVFRCHKQMVRSGIAYMQFGPSTGGAASARRMLAVDLSDGTFVWDRQNAMMSQGAYSPNLETIYPNGLAIDDVNGRIICSRGNVGGVPIQSVISQ